MATDSFDILIIGGGHAGAEAAWAASRLGASVALITMDASKIGAMSCNPAIGGLAKGQMVREIDALGGLMGLAIDQTGIQFRMLNRSKGPAVWGPRAQADKYKYASAVQKLLSTCPSLSILAGEVAEILVGDDGKAVGVALSDGSTISSRAVVVTTGTFLRGLMHSGETKTEGGRIGEAAARGLSGCLAKLGLELGRLKTGTPPRLRKDSIDFSAFEPQDGDAEPFPFSFLNEYRREGNFAPPLPQVQCFIGATTPEIHAVIRANLHRAPMYSGQITSTGPRYCPSIEDKVTRFAEKEHHQIFLEPEGLDTDEIYCNGISTSLPRDVQDQIVHGIRGLEKAEFLRYGYAVEYDMVWPSQIDATLMTKLVPGLFLAGQINGTSGYEEAGAQGLMAGINAAQYAKSGVADFVLRRDQAYIGVLIDDLVTKPPTEPYRMFTSRAEHRLQLRSDNADARLTPIGREIGLVEDSRWKAFEENRAAIESAMAVLSAAKIDGISALDILRRSDADIDSILPRVADVALPSRTILRQVEIAAKYAGYIARQDRQIERFATLEAKLIPTSIDYARVMGLRNEAKQKLTKFTPRSLGQALRISGITPADVTLLAVHLSRN